MESGQLRSALCRPKKKYPLNTFPPRFEQTPGTSESTESNESIESTKSTESTESTESIESIESVDSIELMDSIESMDSRIDLLHRMRSSGSSTSLDSGVSFTSLDSKIGWSPKSRESWPPEALVNREPPTDIEKHESVNHASEVKQEPKAISELHKSVQ